MLRKGAGEDLGAGFLLKAMGEHELLRPCPDLPTEPWARAGLVPLALAETE